MKSNITKRNLKKTLLLLVCIVVVGISALIFTIINSLPSLKEISSQFSKNKNTLVKTEDRSKSISNLKSESSTDPSDLNQPENEKLKTENAENAEIKKLKAKQTIQNMLNEDPRDIRVCDNLGQSKSFKSPENTKYENLFFEGDRSDSIAEALRLPIRSIFQEENMHSLLDEIFQYETELSNLNNDETEGFLKKIGFYSKVTWTVAQLYKKKVIYEKLADRSGHLAVLARIAVLKPELANDPQIIDFCRQLESSIGAGQEVDLKDERTEILELIKYSGFTPEQLKFDPNKFTEFKMKSSKEGLNFSLSDQR